LYYILGSARIGHSIEGNTRLRLIVYTFVVTQGNFYCQDIPPSLLGIPHDLEDNILVAKCLLHPCGLSKGIELQSVARLLCRLSIALLYRDVCSITSVTAVNVHGRVCTFIGGCVVSLIHYTIFILIAVVKGAELEERAVAGVTGVTNVIIIEVVLVSSIRQEVTFVPFLAVPFALHLFCFAKRVLACLTLQSVDELCWPTACVYLEEYDRSDIVSIVLGREDQVVSGLVLGQEQEEVV
jgi:hypothetical protein